MAVLKVLTSGSAAGGEEEIDAVEALVPVAGGGGEGGGEAGAPCR